MNTTLLTVRENEIISCFDDTLWLIYAEVWREGVRKPTVHELQSLRRRGFVDYRPGWVSASRLGRWALTEKGIEAAGYA